MVARGPALTQTRIVRWLPRLFAGRRILLHDPAGGNLLVGTLVLVDAKAEPERRRHLGGVVHRPADQRRHLDLTRAQRHAHGKAEKDEECQAERADEDQEFAETPDASAEAH